MLKRFLHSLKSYATSRIDRKDLGVVFGAILLALLGGLRYHKDYVYAGWFGGLSLLSCCVGLSLFSRDKLVGLAFTYFSLNAAYIGLFRGNHFSPSPDHVKLFLSSHALSFYCALLLFTLALKPQKVRLFFQNAFGWLCLFNSILVIIGYGLGFGKLPAGAGYSGLIDYAGMNGCLIAISYPLFLKVFFKKDFVWLAAFFLLPIIAIFLSFSSVPWGAFLLAMAGIFIQVDLGISKKQLWFLFIGATTILLGFIRIFDASLFTDGQRFKAYKLFMTNWWEHLPVINGSGPGTFVILGPEIQLKTGWLIDQTGEHVSTFFTFLHSDFLQVMFETGIIGFIFIVLIYLRSLVLSYKRFPLVFSSLLSYGGVALLNFPLRYFLTALLGAILLVLPGDKDAK